MSALDTLKPAVIKHDTAYPVPTSDYATTTANTASDDDQEQQFDFGDATVVRVSRIVSQYRIVYVIRWVIHVSQSVSKT